MRYDFAFLWGLLVDSEVQNIDRNSPQGMPSGERFSSLGQQNPAQLPIWDWATSSRASFWVGAAVRGEKSATPLPDPIARSGASLAVWRMHRSQPRYLGLFLTVGAVDHPLVLQN